MAQFTNKIEYVNSQSMPTQRVEELLVKHQKLGTKGSFHQDDEKSKQAIVAMPERHYGPYLGTWLPFALLYHKRNGFHIHG